MAAIATSIDSRTAPGSPLPTNRLRRRVLASDLTDGGSVTTYYYREAGGARGSTTSMASIPAGATVQRKVTV